MIQIYPLSLAYLVLSSLLYFSAAMPERFRAVYYFRMYLIKGKYRFLMFFYSGLALFVLTLLFPIYPGPVFLGDMAVASALFFSSFALKEKGSEKGEGIVDPKQRGRNVIKGCALIVIALLHLLFPSFIII